MEGHGCALSRVPQAGENGAMLQSMKLVNGMLSRSGKDRQRSCRPLGRAALIAALLVMVLQDWCLASGGVREIPLDGITTGTWGIASDPNGYLWATVPDEDLVIKMRPDGTIVGSFPTFPAKGPYGLVIGPENSVWFAASGTDSIGQMDRDTGTMIMNWSLPETGNNLTLLAVGWDDNIWITQDSQNMVGIFNTISHKFEDPIMVTSGSRPYDIIAGPLGNMWFTEYGNGHAAIGEITPARQLTEHKFDDGNTAPFNLTPGPDGFLWFTANGPNAVVRMNPNDYSTPKPIQIPTPESYSHGITVGADGNLYIAETYGNHIGQITLGGVIAEFSVSPGSEPVLVTSGPDGNIWFSEASANQIGKLYVLSATGATIDGSVGEDLRAVVATFHDDEPGMVAESYTAQIDWGDGTAPSTGEIFKEEGDGQWIATGDHTYTQAGTYAVTVTIIDTHPGGMTMTVRSAIDVLN
jgi:streptogramin lyase